MRSLTRLSAFDELPYTKLAAAAPTASAADPQAAGSSEATAPPAVAAEADHPAEALAVPFVLPPRATPLQQLLLAFCLQRLEAVCPRALLQFLPAMQQFVASCGEGLSSQQQQQQWLTDRACGLTLSTLGRLCMRRFLESSKILKVLRRKCAFVFDTLRAPAAATEGYVLILFANTQDLAEQIDRELQELHEGTSETAQTRTDSGLSPELEAQVQQQLLLLEEVALTGFPFARSVALKAAALILGPLYAASVEAASAGPTATAAAGGSRGSVRLACKEGIGGIVLHLPLKQMEIRASAALLAAAMSKERVARGATTGQTAADLLQQQQQQKLGSLLAKNASVCAVDTAGNAQSERALLRLLLLSAPRPSKGRSSQTQEARGAGFMQILVYLQLLVLLLLMVQLALISKGSPRQSARSKHVYIYCIYCVFCLHVVYITHVCMSICVYMQIYNTYLQYLYTYVFVYTYEPGMFAALCALWCLLGLECTDVKELRAHAQQEVRDIARNFVTTEPLMLLLLPRLCEFFVKRYSSCNIIYLLDYIQ